MTIASVTTRGFLPGDSSRALVTLLGFGQGGVPPPPPPVVIPQPGGAPAWWGYEYFDQDGAEHRRPWWYRDLKDKAKELERLRQRRIEIGLLPPDERQADIVVEQTIEFLQEQPRPETADYYLRRYEQVSARIDALVEQFRIMEQESQDEEDLAMILGELFNE